MKAQFVILSGSSNRKLALTTAELLGVEIGDCSLARFPDTRDWPQVKVISLAPLLAEAVRRVMDRA